MRPRCRLTLAALASAAVLAAAVGIASAAPNFTWVGPSVKMTWSSLAFEAGGSTVRCPVTLEGTITTSTFNNVARTRIGTVTRASLGTCTGGTLRVLAETLPWNLQYSTFGGTLPSVTSVTLRLVGVRINIRPAGLPECLFGTTEANPALLTAEREALGALTGVSQSATIPLEGFLCAFVGNGRISGAGSIVETGEMNPQIEVVIEGQGDRLVVPGQARLNDVEVPKNGGVAMLTMTNTTPLRKLHIVSVQTVGANRERFIVNGGAGRCEAGNELMKNAADNCINEITSANPTAAGVESMLRITYTLFPNVGPIEQEFKLRTK